MYVCMYVCIYISIYISTDTCFAVPQLISVAWYNLDKAWQPFIRKRLPVTTACGTIAVMRISREHKAIWCQSTQTTTRVVGFALLLKDTLTNFTECSTTPKWRSVIYIYYIYTYLMSYSDIFDVITQSNCSLANDIWLLLLLCQIIISIWN